MKRLRFQQQYTFFDPEKAGKAIHYVNLSDTVKRLRLKRTLDALNSNVVSLNPSLVVVDSFGTLLVAASDETSRDLQSFLHDLSVQLTSWQTTTLLVGEYGREELTVNAAFTVADGIIWLTQDVILNSVVRKLQVIKMRGQDPITGPHTFRIDKDGIHVFQRMTELEFKPADSGQHKRLSTGTSGLDELPGGGLPSGKTTLVAGPSGTGKTTMALQFLVAGVEAGERG